MEKFKKKSPKIGEDGDEKHFIFIHYLLGYTSSIVRTGIILTPNPNP